MKFKKIKSAKNAVRIHLMVAYYAVLVTIIIHTACVNLRRTTLVYYSVRKSCEHTSYRGP